MKSNNRRSGKRCHGLAGLPLFDWRQTLPPWPSTPAGAYVTRKFGVAIAIEDVAADLKGWLGDLDAAEALHREQLDQIAGLRAQVYRHAKARGVTPTMLRHSSAYAEVTAMADDLEAEIATLEADAEREKLDIKHRLSRLSTRITDLKPTLKVAYDRAAVVAITVLQMLLDVDEFDRDELQIRLETLLREEFADIARQFAVDLGAQS